MKVDGGWGRNRTGVHGFAGRCITTLPPSQRWCLSGLDDAAWRRKECPGTGPEKIGAGNETRTRDPNLGKVVLYQLSYSRPKGVILLWFGRCLSSAAHAAGKGQALHFTVRDRNARPGPVNYCQVPISEITVTPLSNDQENSSQSRKLTVPLPFAALNENEPSLGWISGGMPSHSNLMPFIVNSI
jgi:hypothetical protein